MGYQENESKLRRVVMPDEIDDIGGADSNIDVCVHTLDRMIEELANRYGAASVVAALTEVVGCSACADDQINRGTSIRALMRRINVT
jgi:hypothetical protein